MYLVLGNVFRLFVWLFDFGLYITHYIRSLRE